MRSARKRGLRVRAIEAMRHSARHSDVRHELEGLDPMTMLVIPLAILLLSLLIIRAILAISVV
jgi:hypothetical protein